MKLPPKQQNLSAALLTVPDISPLILVKYTHTHNLYIAYHYTTQSRTHCSALAPAIWKPERLLKSTSWLGFRGFFKVFRALSSAERGRAGGGGGDGRIAEFAGWFRVWGFRD